MPTFLASGHFKATPESTFAAFADFRNAPANISAIKRLDILTDGPIGKGTRFRETRLMMGREATEVLEITDFQPGREYTVRIDTHGTRWDTTFRFTPENGGTRVDAEMRMQPMSLLAKITAPLLRGMYRKMMLKCLADDMHDLKKVVEGD